MKAPGRRITAVVAAFAIVASLCVGMRPPSIRAFDPLPSIDLLSPLPSIDLLSPLPSVNLGSPLPSVNLGSPLPSVNLGTPLPSVNLGTPLPTPSSAQPRRSPAESPEGGGGASPSSASPSPGVVERSSTNPPAASATERSPVGTSASDDAGSAEPVGIPELGPPTPRLSDVGSWLVPAVGVGVPFIVAILAVLAQVFGGAGAVHFARRVVNRIPVTARGQHSLKA